MAWAQYRITCQRDRVTTTAKRKGPAGFYTFIDLKWHNQETLSNMISGFTTSSGHKVACSGWAPGNLHKDAGSLQALASNWRSELKLKPLSGEDLKSKETTASKWENSLKSITCLTVVAEHKEKHQNQASGTLPFAELTEKTGFLQLLDLLLHCCSQWEFCPWLWQGTVSDWQSCQPMPDRLPKIGFLMQWSRKYQSGLC